MRRNSFKLHRGKLRLDITENFFTQKVVRLLKEVMDSPSLEEFKRCVDVAPGIMV